jgi:hypothetical protein
MTVRDGGAGDVLGGLERDVVDELRLAEGSDPRLVMASPVGDWGFDPTETERYVEELHSLLDAVRAVGPRGSSAPTAGPGLPPDGA